MNDRLVSESQNHDSSLMKRSESMLKFLVEQVLQRITIIDNLETANSREQGEEEKNDQQPFTTNLSDVQTTSLAKLFDILTQLLSDEGLTTTDVDYDILTTIEKAKEAAIKNDWKNAHKHLVKIVESVMPFDIEKLVQCYGEFSHVSNKLVDKNLVLFIGRTGSGKSTTIHFLKGTKFIRDPKHQTHFIPDSHISNDLKHIKLDHRVSESVTKYITPVAMSLEDDKNVKFIKNRIVLCDTPGIGDSHGIEVEVANLLSLIHAIRNSNSVCIVLVISDEEKANRGKLFKETGQYVKKLLNHYKSEECDIGTKLEDIGVIFTKFNDKKEIYDFFDKFVGETNPSVDGFYMAKKIAYLQDLILIDPITSRRQDIIIELFTIAEDNDDGEDDDDDDDSDNDDSDDDFNDNRVKWIDNTTKHFKDDIPADALGKIKDQVKNERCSVKHLTSVDNPNFNLIEGKLNNLKNLSEIIKSHKFIGKDLKKSTKKVNKVWVEICRKIRKHINIDDKAALETFNNNIGTARKLICEILESHSTLQEKYLEEAPSYLQMRREVCNQFREILSKVDFNPNADTDSNVAMSILECLVIGLHFQDDQRIIVAWHESMNKMLQHCQDAIKNNKYSTVRYLIKTIENVKNEWSTFSSNMSGSYVFCFVDFFVVVVVLGCHEGLVLSLTFFDVVVLSMFCAGNLCFGLVCEISNEVHNKVKHHLKTSLDSLTSSLGAMMAGVSKSGAQLSDAVNESRRLFKILEHGKEMFGGVDPLAKKSETIIQQATALLDEKHEQLQQQIVKILETKEKKQEQDDEETENNETWDTIQRCVNVLHAMRTIDNKFSLKHSSMDRETMNKIVNQIITETAENNDLNLIKDNFGWIREYHTDCSKLEQLYNDLVIQHLRIVEKKCHECSMNVGNLDVIVNDVKQIAQLIHKVTKYCENTDIVNEIAVNDSKKVQEALRDRVSDMVHNSLNIDWDLDGKDGESARERISILKQLQVAYNDVFNDKSWQVLCEQIKNPKSMTSGDIFDNCQRIITPDEKDEEKTNGNDNDNDNDKDAISTNINHEKQSKDKEIEQFMENIVKCKDNILALESKSVKHHNYDEESLITMRNDEQVLQEEIEKRESVLNDSIVADYFKQGKIKQNKLLTIEKMNCLLEFIQTCNQIFSEIKVLVVDKSQAELVHQFLKQYGKHECKQINNAMNYFVNQTAKLSGNVVEAKDESVDESSNPSENVSDIGTVQTPSTEADAISNAKQIIDINAKYPKLKQCMFSDDDIDDLVNTWKNTMNEVLDNFENVLNNGNLRELNEFPAMISLIVALERTKNCGILDKDRFIKLYNDTKGTIDDDYQTLIQNISSRNFSPIGEYMNAFDVKKLLGKQYESLRGFLAEMLLEFGIEVNSALKIAPLTLTEYEAFAAQFDAIIDQLNEIKTHELDNHVANNHAGVWKAHLHRMTLYMEQWQRKLVRLIEKNANKFMMGPAHARIEILTQIWDKTKDSYLEISNKNEVSRSIDKTLNKQLNALEKVYSNVCIYEARKWRTIKKNFPFYDDQIRKTMQFCQMNNNNKKYYQLYFQLCKNIENTYKSSFKNTLTAIAAVNKNYYEHCVELAFLKLLLDGVVFFELNTGMEQDLKYRQVCNSFHQKKTDEDELLFDEIQQWDFDDICTFTSTFVKLCFNYHSRKEYKDEIVASRLLSIMSEKMETQVDNIHDLLENVRAQGGSIYKLKSVLKSMKQITNMQKIQDISALHILNRQFEEIHDFIEKWANDGNSCILQNLDAATFYDAPILSSPDTVDDIQDTLQCLCDLIILNGKNSYEPFIDDRFCFSFGVEFIKNTHQRLGVFREKFETAVEMLDYYQIETYFKYIELYDNKTKCYDIIRKIYNEIGLKIVVQYPLCIEYTDDVMLNFEKMTDIVVKRLSKVQKKIMNRRAVVQKHQFSSMAARIEFYEKVKQTLQNLKDSERLIKYLNVNPIDKLYRPCLEKISKEIKQVTKQIANTFKEDKIGEKSFKMINDLFSNLQAIANVHLTGNITGDKNLVLNINSIKKKIVQQLVSIGEACDKTGNNIVKAAKFFIKLQMASHHLLDAEFKEVTAKTIVQNLKKYQAKHGILELAKVLTSHKQLSDDEIIWGKEIVNSQNIFNGAKIQLWNEKISPQMRHIGEVLHRTFVRSTKQKFNSNFKETIKKQYYVFERTYGGLLDKFINYWNIERTLEQNLMKCVTETITLASEIIRNNPDITKKVNTNFGENIAKLIAHIFTLWTLLDSKYYFDYLKAANENNDNESKTEEVDNDSDNPKRYLKQPKVTQVVAIMILMSLDNPDMKLVSNLVQIGTGEGKSLVLAVLACVFALLGYNVYCVSYGKLLAQRDSDAFLSLFCLLRVSMNIDYGTYEELCGQLIGEIVSFPKFRQIMLGKNGKYSKRLENDWSSYTGDNDIELNEKRILLVDEVDVFFNKKYFGQTIGFGCPFRDACISDLIDLIWRKMKGTHQFDYGLSMMNDIKRTNEYHNVCKLFGFYMVLIDGEIREMLKCARLILNGAKGYVIYNDKIGYKQNDYITTNYADYMTLFAYYLENERGNISGNSLNNAKCLTINVGLFSYAEIPVSFNNVIVGVTGTLISITDEEKKILQEIYNINKYAYMPSIFKECKLDFETNKDVHAYSQTEFYSQLLNSIKNGRQPQNCNNNNQSKTAKNQHRPVLVFFKDDKSLKEFYNSNEFGGLRNETLILNEELTHDEKMKLIKDTCRLNTITLATRIFGRGTDFQVIDERVNKIGGTHVIQTFFSLDISEEVQIKGRTARHGDPGSFSMVLDLNDVCSDFGIIDDDDKKEIESAKDVYECLAGKREEKMQDANKMSLSNVQKAKEKHAQAYQLQKVIRRNNREEILAKLLQLNE